MRKIAGTVHLLFILPVLWMTPDFGYSQNLDNLAFWHLTPNEGLSQSTVSAIYQDSEGFMWFGTQEGLNKYEGQNNNIVVYKHDPDDPSSIGSNEIEAIYEDSRGNLWIATDWGGLSLYNRDDDSFIRFTATDKFHDGSISDNTTQVIYEDSHENLWIGTYNGLNLMDREKGTFKNFLADSTNRHSLSSNYILDIIEDETGQIWVATINGLNRMHRDSVAFDQIFVREGNSFDPANYMRVIYEDRQGRLWVGTESGLYQVYKNTLRLELWNQKISSSTTILDITEDKQGVIWVGTENEGLLAIHPDNSTTLFTYSENNIQGLNSNSIYSLYQSRDNILWVGTFDGGVNILNRKENKFRHFKNQPGVENSLNENSIMAFLKPDGKYLWIGTDGGGINLLNMETESFDFIRHEPDNPNSLSSDVILDMMQDSGGRIWIGTYNGGLVRYDPETHHFRNYRLDADDPNSLSQDQVFTVFEDNDGFIWAGTNGTGLNKLVDEEKGIFERWNVNSTTHYFPQSYLRDTYVDEEGGFWLTTYGSGVCYFNHKTGEYRVYNSNEGNLNSGVVLDIYSASDGTIWVGTKGGGLAKYNSERDEFESYTTEDGMPNDIVNAILEDDHGNLWASSNNGITRFSPKDQTFKNYSLSDGLQSREFKPFAAAKLDNGWMYFGGINGFNEFHPDSIREDTIILPIAFTDFQLSNKLVPIGENSLLKKQVNQVEEITLPYNETNVTIKYSVLNYNPYQEYSYAYILEGFDEDWNEVGNQNSATYTNLDPGEYIFKVKTANSDGYWGTDAKQFKLSITPPFWQTNWFYALSFITIAGLIFGGFKYRTRQITEHNKRLEKEVNIRTQELRESNKDLKEALDDLKATRKELVENAHKAGMADIAAGVVHNIGNVLNSINTSTSLTGEVLKKSKFKGLKKVNELLQEHKDDLADFLENDPKGQKLLDYLQKLDASVTEELQTLEKYNNRLDKKVKLINDVIAAQQSYANVGLGEQEENLVQILEDTLTIFSASFSRHDICIEKEIEAVPKVSVQKTKLVHIILNILKNAKESMIEAGVENRKISIKVWQHNPTDKYVMLRISDNGTGIDQKNLRKVFNHGFTTKQKGHGFGLHSSANYMTEMGGKIDVQNREGEQGASFTLQIPVSGLTKPNMKVAKSG